MNEELKITIKAVTDDARKKLSDVKDELKDIKTEGQQAGKTLKETLTSAAKKAAATITAITALTAAMMKLGQASDEFTKAIAKVNTAFQSMGSNSKQATKTFKELYRFLGDNDRAAETAQSLALITTNEKDLAEWTNILQGAFGLMGDKLPIEGLAEAANETIKVGQVTGVLADALNWAGISEDAFNQQLAQTTSLSEREALLRSTLNGIYSNAAAIYERNNKAQIRLNESQYSLNVALAEAARYITPLRTEVNNLGAAFLTLLGPAIQTVSAYLTAFIQILTEAIKWVGSFFGMFGSSTEGTTAKYAEYQAAVRAYTESLQQGFNATAEGGEAASDALNALKKQTMGFDELNIVGSNTAATTGTGGAGGGGSGSGLTMPNPEDYGIGAPQVEEFQKKIENAKETLKAFAIAVGVVAAVFAAWKIGRIIGDLWLLYSTVDTITKTLDITKRRAFVLIEAAETRIDSLKYVLQRAAGAALVFAGVFTMVSGIKDLISDGYSMEAVLKVLAGVILTVVGVLLLFNAALLANPITWIVIGIAAAVAAFVILWNECDAFREFWIKLWDGIKKVWSKFVDSIQPLIDALVKTFKEGWALIKVIFSLAWDGIKATWDAVKPYFEALWNNIKIIFSFVKEFLTAVFKAAWEGIKAVWSVVVGYFTAIWNSIAGIFSVVRNVLQGNWQGAWDAIKGIVGTWGKFFQQVWDSIKRIFAAVKDYFYSVFNAAWKAITGIFNNVGNFFVGVWNKIASIFNKAAGAIGDSVGGAFASAINWVLDKAIGIINGFIGAINGAIGIINKIPGVNITKLSKLDVPQLATGGIVNGATMAMIGERGKEAVLPLENNTEWMDLLAERINGNAPTKIVLQLDGKALGEATIASINGVTRQSGKLQLIMA